VDGLRAPGIRLHLGGGRRRSRRYHSAQGCEREDTVD